MNQGKEKGKRGRAKSKRKRYFYLSSRKGKT